MSIWKKEFSLELINSMNNNTASKSLGIEITEITNDCVIGKMPVDNRTRQIHGILHGGASVLFAETIGSIAGHLATSEEQSIVGLDINANHLSAVSKGYVKGIAKALHIGKTTHVWEIKISNEENDKLVCISRLTLYVIKNKNNKK